MTLHRETYSNNNTLCLTLIKRGEPYMTLSTNLNSELQGSQTVFINQSSDELKEAKKLVKAGVLSPLFIMSQSGYNTYQLYLYNGELT